MQANVSEAYVTAGLLLVSAFYNLWRLEGDAIIKIAKK
jgi:hypothetical protein